MPEPTEIFINGRFLVRRATGVDRFARELLGALDTLLAHDAALAAAWRFTLLLPPEPAPVDLPAYSQLRVSRGGRLRGGLWEQLALPWLARGRLLVSLCNAAPALKRRQVVVIHDAAPARVPASYSRSFRLWYALLMPWLGRVAQRVLTVSDFSRRELTAVYGIPAARIRQLPESGEHIRRVAADPAILARHGLVTRPYVLGVSSMSPHKGFATLVGALEQLGADAGFDVAIAGGTNPRIFAGTALPPWVKHLGYVSDAELRALYENAACFVFPSWYEGFGLPAAEAMALGCPVIAARAASIPEVCGNAACYVAPRNAPALAAALRHALSDPAWRERARREGLAQSQTLRWADSARAFLVALAELRDPCPARATPALRHADTQEGRTQG
ncbi:MAG: glycosyltransferase family 1 protein [Candidatus Dactylopiibacterium sp.]|nr:glycosyltransferase family 1 protein [Candidatus Dactylopiibacterium sp.]